MSRKLRFCLLLSLLLSLLLVAGYLYAQRSPRRTVPAGPGLIVSPASGKVLHIEQVAGPNIAFFKKDVLNELTMLGMAPPFQLVVIELNLLDVHVQRAPIAGRVIAQQHYPGRFRNALYSADPTHLANSNEKLLTVLSNERTAVGVVQVAGLVARRINAAVGPGEAVARGQLIGNITFGSQVVAVLGTDAVLQVAVGQRVVDGETIMAQVSTNAT